MRRTGILLSLSLLALGAAAAPARGHYLDRFNPVLRYDLDLAPDDTNALEAIDARAVVQEGQTPPKQIAGARPYTGKAWDFTETTACCVATAGPGGTRLGDIDKTTGLSGTYWQKGEYRLDYNNAYLMDYKGTDYRSVFSVQISNQNSVLACVGPFRIDIPRQDGLRLFDGDWHHVAFTVDFARKTGNIAIYLDGKEVARGSGEAFTSFNTSDPNHAVVLGARGNTFHSFTGAIDDVAIFDYALSGDQVAAVMAGPVFAGVDQVVYLPLPARLTGLAPAGEAVAWSKVSGPGEVQFADAGAAQTTASLSTPGEYVLQLEVDGHTPSTIGISVTPPAPPVIAALDPIQLPAGQTQAMLTANVYVPGYDTLEGVTFQWKKLEGPGEVTFAPASAPTTTADFSTPGLYRLQLTATHNGLSTSTATSVLLAEPAKEHYALPLGPLYVLPLDAPANRKSGGIVELTGSTGAEIRQGGERLPIQSPGARAFTGQAWDFGQSGDVISVVNRWNIARLGEVKQTDGVSLSFWLCGKDYVRDYGLICGLGQGRIFDIAPGHLGEGRAGLNIYFQQKQKRMLENVFDGEWHHIAITADYRAMEDNVRVYVDGNLTNTFTDPVTQDFPPTGINHFQYWAARGNGGGPFKGELDDIVVFNRAIGPADVGYLFNGPPTTEAPSMEDVPQLDMGDDQVHKLPAQTVTLNPTPVGTAHDQSTRYRWRLIEGPGEVSFSSPDKLQTEVDFQPPGPEVFNPDYRRYAFELTATNLRDGVALVDSKRTTVIFCKPVAPRTRKLSKTPPPGVHPRIFFTAADLPGMRTRAAEDPVAQVAISLMKERITNSIDNPEHLHGRVYQRLLANEDVDVTNAIGWGVAALRYTRGYGDLYGNIMGAAFLAVLEEDDARASELATVLSRAATAHSEYYRTLYYNQGMYDADPSLGLAYDLLYNHMTEAQRAPIRALLAQMTAYRQTWGTGMPLWQNAGNGRLYHDGIVIASLAIEGEEGYDPILYKLNVRKLRDFLTQYGVFRSGYGHEGWGYTDFGFINGALTAYATSRREENLYETTNLYKLLLAQYYSMPPGVNFVLGHGDTVGSKRLEPGNQLWIGRFLWPDDPAVQALGNQLTQNIIESHDQRELGMMAVMFAVGEPEPNLPKTAEGVAKALELPLTLFCKDKGYINTRSHWGDDALMLTFRCRMDKYDLGHVHPDVNTFEFFSHGVEWFTDLGKFAMNNDMHQTVMIDGVGASGCSGIYSWPSMAGKLLDVVDTPRMTMAIGDAKPAYDYTFGEPVKLLYTGEFTPTIATNHGLTWANFVYKKTRNDPMPAWRKGMAVGFHGNPVWINNPVLRANRSAYLFRGKYPFALIVDDIQKDDKPHDYMWVANARPGQVERVSTQGSDMILKPSEETKAPNPAVRLLVRAIHPANTELTYFNATMPIGPKSEGRVNQVRIEAKGVMRPNFVTLLFPHIEGTPLPETTLEGKKLTVLWDDETVTIVLPKE